MHQPFWSTAGLLECTYKLEETIFPRCWPCQHANASVVSWAICFASVGSDPPPTPLCSEKCSPLVDNVPPLDAVIMPVTKAHAGCATGIFSDIGMWQPYACTSSTVGPLQLRFECHGRLRMEFRKANSSYYISLMGSHYKSTGAVLDWCRGRMGLESLTC